MDGFPFHKTRNAMTVLEVMLALAVLSLAFVLLAQFLTASAQQRRVSERRRIALQEVANSLERVAALPWDEVTSEKLAAWKPSSAASTVLSQAQMRSIVATEPGPPEVKRVRIEVAWTDASGQLVEPIGLTTFVYRPREVQP